jgi:hypothetical protein
MQFKKGQTPWNKGMKLHYQVWNKGIPQSEEAKRKMREKLKGRIPWNKGIKYEKITGEKHFLWKGNNVGYFALHSWISRNKGKPSKCERCGKKKKKYEWANISGEYKRDLNDYESLCVACHRIKDLKGHIPWNKGKKLHYDVWNKGKKTGLIPKTAFKKGVIPKGSIVFEKGHIPWNKIEI